MSEARRAYSFLGRARLVSERRQLMVVGIEADSGLSMRAIFGVCEPGALPQRVHNLSIEPLPAVHALASGWRLKCDELDRTIMARSLQVQREIRDLAAAALPSLTASLRGRIGWAVLLNLLRVPGSGWLLRKWRG
jgi:hypothetical protein